MVQGLFVFLFFFEYHLIMKWYTVDIGNSVGCRQRPTQEVKIFM